MIDQMIFRPCFRWIVNVTTPQFEHQRGGPPPRTLSDLLPWMLFDFGFGLSNAVLCNRRATVCVA